MISPARDRQEPPGGFMIPVAKSAGPTSRRIVDRVGRTLNRRDIGHAGTLDPFASGLLLVLAGRAAKLVPYIHEWDKEYEALIRLGESTDSLDPTGLVTARCPVPPDVAGRIPAAAARLVGVFEQAPPMLSAVRSGGVRLYELARRGIEIERPVRARLVHRFEIVSIDLPDVRARVTCDSGTYVRSLAEALGKELGLPAHLAALQRTRIGPVTLARAISDDMIEALPAADLVDHAVPLVDILCDWPAIHLDQAGAREVTFGRIPVEVGDAAGEQAGPAGDQAAGDQDHQAAAAARCGERFRLLGPDGNLLALIERRPRSEGGSRFLRVLASVAGNRR